MANIFKAKTLLGKSGIFSQEVIAPNLVYNTGNQIIFGNKNFYGNTVLSGDVNVLATLNTSGYSDNLINISSKNLYIENDYFAFADDINTGYKYMDLHNSNISLYNFAPGPSPSLNIYSEFYENGVQELATYGGSINLRSGNIAVAAGDIFLKNGKLIWNPNLNQIMPLPVYDSPLYTTNLYPISPFALKSDSYAFILQSGTGIFKDMGIGTDSPSEKLEVKGNLKLGDIDNASAMIYLADRPNASYNNIRFQDGEMQFNTYNGKQIAFTFNNSGYNTLFSHLGSGEYTMSFLKIPTGKNDFIALNGDLVSTGFNLNSKINALSGNSVLIFGNQTINGNKTFVNNLEIQDTGIFNSLDLSNISDFQFSGTNINLIDGNVYVTGNGSIYVSGKPVLTGVDLTSYVTTSYANSTYATINNLNLTGSNLYNSKDSKLLFDYSLTVASSPIYLGATSGNNIFYSIGSWLIGGPTTVNILLPNSNYLIGDKIYLEFTTPNNISVNLYKPQPGPGYTLIENVPQNTTYKRGWIVTRTVSALPLWADMNDIDGNLSSYNAANTYAKITSLSNYVQLTGPQIVSGNKTFAANTFFQNDIIVTGNIRGSGTAYFNDNLNITNNLTVGGNINNPNLVLTKGKQIISGDKTFADTISLNAYTGNGYDTSNLDFRLNIAGNTNENAGISIDAYGINGPQILMRRARGIPTGLSGVLKDDVLFNLQGRGYISGLNQYSSNSRAAIRLLAAEDWVVRQGYTGQGTYILFRTTNVGSGLAMDKVIIGTDGIKLLDGNIYFNNGGYINLSNAGGSINASNYGGNIYTYGSDIINIGGSINTYGAQGAPGGNIYTYAGLNISGGSINLSQNSGANFSIQTANLPATENNGSIYNKVNDNLYIRKNNAWEKVITDQFNPVYTTGNQTINGTKNFTTRPTVNGSGVLLNGEVINKSNYFILNFGHTSDQPSASSHNYFAPHNLGFNASGPNRRYIQILETGIARKASWQHIAGTALISPTLNCTGYFINTSTIPPQTGVISTGILSNNINIPNNFTGMITPPVTINAGDYVVCSLFTPAFTPSFSGVRDTVNIYCYY